MKKVLVVATVQIHIATFHKPIIEMLQEKGYEVHVCGKDNLAEKKGRNLDEVDNVFDVPFERSPFSLKNIKAYKMLKNIINENKYDVVPGLTGWAQINGRDELPIDVKAKLDGEYVEKLSFVFDVKCFFLTIFNVLNHNGVVEGATSEDSMKETVSVK